MLKATIVVTLYLERLYTLQRPFLKYADRCPKECLRRELEHKVVVFVHVGEVLDWQDGSV